MRESAGWVLLEQLCCYDEVPGNKVSRSFVEGEQVTSGLVWQFGRFNVVRQPGILVPLLAVVAAGRTTVL